MTRVEQDFCASQVGSSDEELRPPSQEQAAVGKKKNITFNNISENTLETTLERI